jgi:hypothetical protein
MDNEKTAGGVAIESTPLLDRSELIAILEQYLAVTDEWGGCKLASWQWGGNVVVDGIDAAADAILARLSNAPRQVSTRSGDNLHAEVVP